MTAFLFIAAAMVAVALGWVLWPLLRPGSARSVEHAAANVSIFKDHFADLDADLSRGIISADQHVEAKRELERRLLDDVRGSVDSTRTVHPARRWSAVIIALIAPLAAAGLYWHIGTPTAFSPMVANAADENGMAREQIETMVTRVKQRLEKDPDNAEGWSILARTQYALGNFAESAAAYDKLSLLIPNNADVLADYADALAMSQGRSFAGKPLALMQLALKIDPTQWKALAMAGSEAFDRKDYEAAVDYWQRLQSTAPADSPVASQVQGSIDQARLLAGGAVVTPAKKSSDMTRSAPAERSSSDMTRSAPAGRSVSGTVTLSPSLQAKVRPEDSVFVFARPADGSRMPVAVVRARVSELPLRFTLDDSRAMAPTAKISGYEDVIVTARVSRSGNAIPASGDLESGTDKVKVGSQGIAVTIDRAVR